MVWQPSMRIWAGDEVKVDARELEEGATAMEGIESTTTKVESGPSNDKAANGEAKETKA